MASDQPFRAGIVAADRREHAVHRAWRGRRAVCGAGRIQLLLETGFDPTRYLSCQQCAQEIQRDPTAAEDG